jgi:lactate permease
MSLQQAKDYEGLMAILLATLPLIVALVMLAILQRSGLQSGLVTMLVAVALALFIPFFHLTPARTGIALGEGVATSLTVLYVLFPALLLYQVQYVTKSIDVLSRGVARLCPDREAQVLLLVLGLAPFVESASGFGVGTVVIIPMLIALGLDTLQAATLGLLGQIAVPWGGLAVGVTLGAQLTGLNANLLGAYTALLTVPLPVGFGLVALAMSGGKTSVRRLWPAALLAGLVLAAGEWLFSRSIGAELAGVLAALPVIALLAGWGHLTARHAAKEMARDEDASRVIAPGEKIAGSQRLEQEREPGMLQTIAPYIVLVALLLLSRLVAPVQDWLETHAILSIPAIHLQFALLYNPGFYVLLAALAAALLLRASLADFGTALLRTLRQFTPGAIAIVSFLAASQVMNDSGMIAVLGTAAAALGSGYVWIAPWLGALGGWLTGSNAGGMAMFAQLQREASVQAGVPLYWLMGAQSGAGSIATMVSPARTVLATTTVGMGGKEGQILRRLGPLILLAVVVVMLLLAWVVLGLHGLLSLP